MLSSPFQIHGILKLAPVLSQKIGENAFGAHFLQLYHKNQQGYLHFLLFFIINKNSSSLQWEKMT